MRARAQAAGGSAGGTAAERRQRQEIEALKATIEKGKLDAEVARKKARAAERRCVCFFARVGSLSEHFVA